MKNTKVLRPAISLLICFAAIIVCLSAAHNFQAGQANTSRVSANRVDLGSYSVTDYSYYGGDAYTGIQQAGADASNNVVVVGITVTDAANMIYGAQRSTANNVAELAIPLNAATTSIAAMGSLLCTAMAFAFALPGVKYLFDLLQVIQEIKAASVSTVVAEEVCVGAVEEQTVLETEDIPSEEITE